MGFSKNGTKDEIDIQSADDKKERVLIEAHAVASKPVSELILRALRANNQKFEFHGIASKCGYMDVKSNGKMYRISVDIVKSDYELDMTPFESAKNKEYLLEQLGRFAKYCETIFDILMETVHKRYPESKSWKLTIDKEKSTMYINESHAKRVGFVVVTQKS
ncbi:MAG: hypothetical protein E6R13_02025 [Spirochaetes bacterium]|nr:MAG: hypothetical protein E6R13_02025 [Spirochaetota bacterium]